MGANERGAEEIRVGVALTALAGVAVIFRFVARWIKRTRLEVDDWLAIASMVFLIAMLIELILWATIGSSGKHFATLNPHQIELFFKIFLSNEFTYGTTSPLVKLTLLMFYRRLFTTKNFRLATDIISATCVAWGVMTIIVSGVQCMPLERYWNIMVPGHCINAIAFVQGIQGINIFLDLCILVLPMPMVWSLQRPWQDKLALSGVFLLGAFAVAAACVRMYTLTLITKEDISYTTYQAVIWTFVEPCIGLTCACLPIIRGLFPSFSRNRSQVSKYGRQSKGGSGNHTSSHVHRPSFNGNSRYFAKAEFVEVGSTRTQSHDGEELVERHPPNDKSSGAGNGVIRVHTTYEVV